MFICLVVRITVFPWGYVTFGTYNVAAASSSKISEHQSEMEKSELELHSPQSFLFSASRLFGESLWYLPFTSRRNFFDKGLKILWSMDAAISHFKIVSISIGFLPRASAFSGPGSLAPLIVPGIGSISCNRPVIQSDEFWFHLFHYCTSGLSFQASHSCTLQSS